MPIFDVDIVTRHGEQPPADLARGLADALGAQLGASPGQVWVRVHLTPTERYAENGTGEGRPFPVFVTFTAADPPGGEALQARLAGVTELVARLTGRAPDNVHVIVAPAARGRIAFGGKLVT